MKTTLTRAVLPLGVAIATLAGGARVSADGQNTSAQKPKDEMESYAGTVLAVKPEEQSLKVKGFIFSKTFNLSDACRIEMEDEPNAALSDLRPSHKVEVYYQDVQGVLVASRIVQHNLTLDGYISSIDPGERKLTIKTGATKRELVAAEHCTIVLKDEKVGTLENLKVGHAVTVAYESGQNPWVARKIEQSAESFVGTIQAIDATKRTVKARSFMAEKKFNLADNCRIVVAGEPDASLRNLRIGDRVEFSFEDANGVLVANRIGLNPNASEGDRSQTAGLNK